MTAMIRNLGKMSAINLLKPLSPHSSLVCSRLRDVSLLSKARIHPFNVLVALNTYQSGCGDKGKLNWQANSAVSDALEEAFYLSFKVGEGCSSTIYHVHYILANLVSKIHIAKIEIAKINVCIHLYG